MTSDPSEFLDACGASGPLQLRIAYPGIPGGMVRQFEHPFALIGRESDNDIALDHRKVSKRHAYLQIVNGRVFCLDLDSRTGTRWDNGSAGSGWLTRDRAIKIGPFVLQIDGGDRDHADSTAESLTQLQAPSISALPDVHVEFLNGNPKQPTWRVRSTLTLFGRNAKCKVRLFDASVSRYHCVLLRTRTGIWVIDLQRGTQVNGESIRFARLDDGDELQVGIFTLRVRAAPPALGMSGYHSRLQIGMSQDTPARAGVPVPPVNLSSLAEALPAILKMPVPMEQGLAPAQGLTAAQAVLVQLVSQLGVAQQQLIEQRRHAMLSQQQMFDQHQQAMTMMVQLLSTWQQDQMDLIRDELSRFHEVTRELKTLHSQLVEQENAVGVRLRVAADPEADVQPVRRSRKAAAPKKRPASAKEIRQDPPSERLPPIGDEDPADIHARLSRRILDLESEQQTLWQKVTGFLNTRLAAGR